MSHQQNRLIRIEWIMSNIEKANEQKQEVYEDKLVSECCLHFGAGERYIKECLKHLATAGKLVRKAEMLHTPKFYQMILDYENDTIQEENNNETQNGDEPR